MTLQLYPWQEEDARWLAEQQTAFILHDPRVGKTPLAMRAALYRGVKRVAMLTKAIARDQMRHEAERWMPGVQLHVDSYERAARLSGGSELRAFRPEVLILDEAQRAKNPKAQRTKAIYGRKLDGIGGFTEGIEAVWSLSGTLAPNHLGETWTHLHARGFTDRGYRSFCEHFCHTWMHQTYGMMVGAPRLEHIPEFRRLLSPISRRRRFRDTYAGSRLPLWRIYRLAMEAADLKRLRALEGAEAARAVQADLARATSDEERDRILASAEVSLARWRRVLQQIKAPLVANMVEELIESGVSKIIVFAWHRDTLDILEQALAKHESVRVDGGTSEKVRNERVRAFQTDPLCTLFLAQIQTANEAISLPAQCTVFAEYSYSPGDILQAAKRMILPGQTHAQEIITCCLPGTADEDVARSVRMKAATQHVFNIEE